MMRTQQEVQLANFRDIVLVCSCSCKKRTVINIRAGGDKLQQWRSPAMVHCKRCPFSVPHFLLRGCCKLGQRVPHKHQFGAGQVVKLGGAKAVCRLSQGCSLWLA